jgi:exodeoxyribonuclease VII small subunit
MAEMSFEEAMKEIESIVAELERGELPLEESIGKFEEAVKLARSCQQNLEAARERISKLVKAEDDSFALEPFDESGED